MIKNILLYRYSFLQKAVLSLLFFVALGSTKALAQFAITEDFRNGGAPDIIIGGPSPDPATGEGRAYLTSGINDPAGAGWLRITNSKTYQKGFAYINKSFPSTMGVLVDFEYKMWRDVPNADGADGIGIFLFNAASNFQLGGYGGSLGYAPGGGSGTGLAGGYVGVGLDAYGNFSSATEGRVGGPGMTPNAVVLRGPTTSDATTNRYLAGVALGDRTGSDGQIRARNELDYNTQTSTRPTDDQFYRRVQIEIVRLDAAGIYYNIIVRWKKGVNDDFTDLITYTTTDVPPALLKLGFAASTGGDRNYHEIRNLMVTTPGNLRVIKKANRDILRTNNDANGTITYTVEVTNDTDMDVSNIKFDDKFTDAYGGDIPLGNPGFEITGITSSGFISASLPSAATLTSTEISGTLVLGAKKTGRIFITGILHTIPPGNVLQNSATAMPDLDEDKNNNTSIVRTPVISEDVDIILTKTVSAECIDSAAPPLFTVYASNIGALPATYNRYGTNGSRITIVNVVPPGYVYDDSSTPYGFAGLYNDPQNGNVNARWSREVLYNTPSNGYTTIGYIARGTSTNGATETLGSGMTYQHPITYTMVPSSGTTTYDDTSSALYFTDFNFTQSIETAQNQTNNNATIKMYAKPGLPTVPQTTYNYCVGDTADKIDATATGTNTLRWYSTLGGFSSEYPITPSTAWGGTFTYYVSQVNGDCEGPTRTITVNVAPNAGTISGRTAVCSGTGPGQLTAPAVTNAAYQWERSTTSINGPFGNINGATLQNYTPGNLTQTTYYRRKVTVSGCVGYTNVHTVRIITGGQITGAQTFCGDGNTYYDPEPITSLDNGGTGTGYGFQWQYSPNNSDWSNINNATGEGYDPGNTNATVSYYRRIKTGTGCNSSATISNTIMINKIASGSSPGAGTINNQAICGGATPTISGTAGTTGGANGGVVVYEWQYNFTSTATGAPWVSVYETGPTYTPDFPITQTTYFRRRTRNVCGTGVSAWVTATVSFQVNPGNLGADRYICYNTPAGQIGPGTQGSVAAGTRGYYWRQLAGTTGETFVAVGTNSNTYTPPGNLTQTTRFRRYTTSTSYAGCEPYDEIIIYVKQETLPGAISGDQNVCGGAAATITGTPATSDDQITYLWERSTNGTTWGTAASNTPNPNNQQNYTPTATGYYRRLATTTCGTVFTNTVLVTIQGAAQPGSISPASQTVCNGVGATINGTTVTNTGGGTITYRWESLVSGVWNTVATSASPNLTIPAATPAGTYTYRRVTLSTLNGNVCESVATGSVTVTVRAAVGAGSITPNTTQTICNGGEVTFTSNGPGTGGGTFTYRYESSPSGNAGTWNTVSGPSTATGYTATNLTATTYFRRVAISNSGGINCEAATNSVQVVVQDAVNPGTISAASTQTICSGSTATLTSTSIGSGSGSITYRWEMSTTGNPGTWSTAPGPNAVDGVNYTTPALTGTRYFRRVTISTQGVACEAFTGTIVVTVQGCKLITNPMIYQRVKN